MSLAQLMLKLWQILLGLVILSEFQNIAITPSIIPHFYKFQENSNEKCHFQLKVQANRKLLLDTMTYKKNWKTQFFFLKLEWGQSDPECSSRVIRISLNLNFGKLLFWIPILVKCPILIVIFLFVKIFYLTRFQNHPRERKTKQSPNYSL